MANEANHLFFPPTRKVSILHESEIINLGKRDSEEFFTQIKTQLKEHGITAAILIAGADNPDTRALFCSDKLLEDFREAASIMLKNEQHNNSGFIEIAKALCEATINDPSKSDSKDGYKKILDRYAACNEINRLTL